MNNFSIIIVDDHQLFIEGLTALLRANDYNVMGFANSGKALLEQLETQHPDLLLMDIGMKEMDGVELSAEVKKRYPEIKILIISMHAKRVYLEKLIEAGVEGYILKSASDEELKTAIYSIVNGGTYFSSQVSDSILQNMLGRNHQPDVILTPREKDVLKLIAEGMNTKEIAASLFISVNTVESHRKNVLLKTGLKNVAHLIRWAFENGHL
ncbi:two component transcriptional regulator, LuxR family [Filimonas lacunae]|uniref:Two component transcriptional regulator, LuxR family n=1 Tax=Filimonas lacunae TaxID=477680 RepID=A0A173MAR9_9BACT|nr:response regulator transcription factor [Filimonas lacunae]BAV04645.1 DNA-binding response regulator, LuxR family [Filimonas lacunae]SIT32519.1 two component transcriptional regulator, LuxR family [Filimonas lacunae]